MADSKQNEIKPVSDIEKTDDPDELQCEPELIKISSPTEVHCKPRLEEISSLTDLSDNILMNFNSNEENDNSKTEPEIQSVLSPLFSSIQAELNNTSTASNPCFFDAWPRLFSKRDKSQLNQPQEKNHGYLEGFSFYSSAPYNSYQKDLEKKLDDISEEAGFDFFA